MESFKHARQKLLNVRKCLEAIECELGDNEEIRSKYSYLKVLLDDDQVFSIMKFQDAQLYLRNINKQLFNDRKFEKPKVPIFFNEIEELSFPLSKCTESSLNKYKVSDAVKNYIKSVYIMLCNANQQIQQIQTTDFTYTSPKRDFSVQYSALPISKFFQNFKCDASQSVHNDHIGIQHPEGMKCEESKKMAKEEAKLKAEEEAKKKAEEEAKKKAEEEAEKKAEEEAKKKAEEEAEKKAEEESKKKAEEEAEKKVEEESKKKAEEEAKKKAEEEAKLKAEEEAEKKAEEEAKKKAEEEAEKKAEEEAKKKAEEEAKNKAEEEARLRAEELKRVARERKIQIEKDRLINEKAMEQYYPKLAKLKKTIKENYNLIQKDMKLSSLLVKAVILKNPDAIGDLHEEISFGWILGNIYS